MSTYNTANPLYGCINDMYAVSGMLRWVKQPYYTETLPNSTSEEILNAMIRHASSAEERINVRVVSFMHSVSVRITCRGTAFDLSEVQSSLQTGGDPETDAVISDLFNRIMSNTLSLKNRKYLNLVNLK